MLNKDIVGTEILQDAENSQEMWENIFRNKEWGKYPPESVIRFIARNFYHKNRDEIHILELGIGTGANLWFCAREGFKVSGCEFSQSGVDRFIQRMQNENLQDKIMQIEVGDYLETLDKFSANQFDALLDVQSLVCNEFEKTKKIIKKAIAKLKNGGKFLSITPSFNNFGFYEDKDLSYHTCKPNQGNYAFTGVVRYSDIQDIYNLYNGENYRITDISLITTKGIETQEQNELYIIQVVKL